MLVHSHLDRIPAQPSTSTWLPRQPIGCFKCGHCKACTYIPTIKEFVNPKDGTMIQLKSFYNCSSEGVIYAAKCPCPKLYVGKTIRQLRRRVLEHIGDIALNRERTLARHMRQVHNKEPYQLRFWVIEQPKLGARKGNLDQYLLKTEARWIFRLNSRTPSGLNEGFTYLPFIKK